MKTIDFYDIHGNPYHFVSHFGKGNDFSYSDPFCGERVTSLDVIDYAMDRLVVDPEIEEADKPWMMAFLLLAKSNINVEAPGSSGFAKMLHHQFLVDNFKNGIDLSKHIQTMDYLSSCLWCIDQMPSVDLVDKTMKSRLSKSFFGSELYVIELPEGVRFDSRVYRSREAIRLFATQVRTHVSDSGWSHVMGNCFFRADGKSAFQEESPPGAMLPCRIEQISIHGERHPEGDYALNGEYYIPLSWVVATSRKGNGYHDVQNGEKFTEMPYEHNKRNPDVEVTTIDSSLMRHSALQRSASQVMDKWIKDHQADAFRDDLMAMPAAKILAFLDISKRLKMYGEVPPERLCSYVHNGHPAHYLLFKKEYRPIEEIACSFSSRECVSSVEKIKILVGESNIQAVYEAMVKSAPGNFFSIPPQFHSRAMGDSLLSHRAFELHYLKAASFNIFADDMMKGVCARHGNTFEKIIELPTYLFTKGNFLHVAKKHGFDPDRFPVSLSEWMKDPEFRKKASSNRVVKKWLNDQLDVGVDNLK